MNLQEKKMNVGKDPLENKTAWGEMLADELLLSCNGPSNKISLGHAQPKWTIAEEPDYNTFTDLPTDLCTHIFTPSM